MLLSLCSPLIPTTMLPNGQHRYYYPHFTDENILSEVKDEQVRSRAGTGVRAHFLHYRHGSLPPTEHPLTHEKEKSGVLRVSRKEYWAKCEGLGFSFDSGLSWGPLDKLLAFFGERFLSRKQCFSALNFETHSMPPWNDQADIIFGLVNSMVIAV